MTMSHEELLEGLRRLEEASPMKCRIVSSSEQYEAVVQEMEAAGLRLAAVSNAGLKHPDCRLTFLPASAFTSEPQGTIGRHGAPLTNKPPRNIKDVVADLYDGDA